MTAMLLLSCVLSLIKGDIIEPPDLEPEFLAPLDNLTAAQGRDVSFTCVVNHLGPYRVAWLKSDSKAILAIHTHLIAQNERLAVTHNGHNTWKLHVSNVQRNDSGTYMCQINSDPMRHQSANLEVVVPPDILNDEEVVGASGGVALEGGTIRLRCAAVGVPEPTVTWRREDSRNIVFRNELGREKESMRVLDGESLLLSHVQRADMGPYLCIASNGVPPSVSKRYVVHVHFHPVIKVANQLVGAPAGSDVTLQCLVEASPAAMNSWYRDNGDKVLPGAKHHVEELRLGDYALEMRLTISDLRRGDFDGYVCASVNALGRAEGSVRLQELHLPKTSTTAASRRVDKPTSPHRKKLQATGRAHPGSKDSPGANKDHKGVSIRGSSDPWASVLTTKEPPLEQQQTPAPAASHPSLIVHNAADRVTWSVRLVFYSLCILHERL